MAFGFAAVKQLSANLIIQRKSGPSAMYPIVPITEAAPRMRWFAVQVRVEASSFVVDRLLKKGFQCFVPAAPVSWLPVGEVVYLGVPVPASYVFCRFDVTRKLPVVM